MSETKDKGKTTTSNGLLKGSVEAQGPVGVKPKHPPPEN